VVFYPRDVPVHGLCLGLSGVGDGDEAALVQCEGCSSGEAPERWHQYFCFGHAAGAGGGGEAEAGGEAERVLERVPPRRGVRHRGVGHREHLRRAGGAGPRGQVDERLHRGADRAGRHQPHHGDHHVERVAAPPGEAERSSRLPN
jgi:hypothetical protein